MSLANFYFLIFYYLQVDAEFHVDSDGHRRVASGDPWKELCLDLWAVALFYCRPQVRSSL